MPVSEFTLRRERQIQAWRTHISEVGDDAEDDSHVQYDATQSYRYICCVTRHPNASGNRSRHVCEWERSDEEDAEPLRQSPPQADAQRHTWRTGA